MQIRIGLYPAGNFKMPLDLPSWLCQQALENEVASTCDEWLIAFNAALEPWQKPEID